VVPFFSAIAVAFSRVLGGTVSEELLSNDNQRKTALSVTENAVAEPSASDFFRDA
jgi:hypothetical protein